MDQATPSSSAIAGRTRTGVGTLRQAGAMRAAKPECVTSLGRAPSRSIAPPLIAIEALAYLRPRRWVGSTLYAPERAGAHPPSGLPLVVGMATPAGSP